MAIITASLFTALDGVVDPAVGNWHFPYFNEEMGEAVDATHDVDIMLFGRVTYDSFAGAWPEREDAGGEDASFAKRLGDIYTKGVDGVLAVGIVFVTNVMLQVSAFMMIVSVLTITLLTFAIAGLALALGVLFPQYGTENAAQIPTSFGGLVFMMLAVPQLYNLMSPAMLLLVAVMIVDGFLVGRKVNRLVDEKFPDHTESRWRLGLYAASRASQMRRMRAPRAQVNRGDPVGFQNLQRIAQDDVAIAFITFDLLREAEQDLRDRPLRERRARLDQGGP